MVGTQVSESRKAHLKMTISTQVLGPVSSTKYKAGIFHPVFPVSDHVHAEWLSAPTGHILEPFIRHGSL